MDAEKILSEIQCTCGSKNIQDIDADGADIIIIECNDCGNIFDYDFVNKKIVEY